MHKRIFLIFLAISVTAMMIVPAYSFLGISDSGNNRAIKTIPINSIISIPQNELKFSPVKYAPGSVQIGLSHQFPGNVNVLVTFSLQNQSRLNSFLANLSNPNSPQYHQYISRGTFASEFGTTSSIYSEAVNYFSQFPGISVTKFSDHVSIQLKGPASSIGKAFNTTISTSAGGSIYHASSIPQLPLYLSSKVSQVEGLTNSPVNYSLNFKMSPAPLSSSGISYSTGYPAPIVNSGVQYIYGSDLQVAYNEQSLLNITYPTGAVVATILWAGTNSNGAPVAPFNPSDVYNYFNSSLPTYEPHSHVYGVPLNGAAPPGPSASQDVTGAYMENTLDLEMVGSTAPGSSIYNVYGPNATTFSLDNSFNFILNPNSTFSNLNNVSVITNSWGAPEYNDTTWYTYLQEAQARGITVLASSGDSGDTINSKKYSSNPTYPGDFVQFPSNMAFNNFGVTSVGGTTLNLNSLLHISRQIVWYETINYTNGSAAGTTSGISQAIPEPLWQSSTSANNILQGKGLGVPDIAAIGNNTLVCITINGAQNLYGFGGTSVASPVEAGIVAEINAVLHKFNQTPVGYLNPILFKIGNLEYQAPPFTSTTGYSSTSPNYNSSLPTLPFYDITKFRNHLYSAGYGYDLVTGWGSIDAYNLSMYLMNASQSYFKNGLKGVSDKLTLNGLNVTSYIYNKTTSTYSKNKFYNASVQQNLFLANQFGAPVYWIQNVIYINGSQKTGWVMNYTGWVIYPFYGQYPSLTLYRYNFPAGKIVSLPHTFSISTWLTNLNTTLSQTMNFQINSQILSIPVPGAAYIIEGKNYTYSLGGHTYYNGPYPDNPVNGGLNPEFGLVGGPSCGNGSFQNPTSGSINAYVMPLGSNSFIPASTKVFNTNIDQTGEIASNLHFSNVSPNSWNMGISNSSTSQGIVDCVNQTFPITFDENGLPNGTNWYVNLSNGNSGEALSGSAINFTLVKGTYNYTVGFENGYISSPSTGSFNLSGNIRSINITFSAVTKNTSFYSIVVNQSGLPIKTKWYFNLTNGQRFLGNGSSLKFNETNGTYYFAVSPINKSYSVSPGSGKIVINGSGYSLNLTFLNDLYPVTFNESGLPGSAFWYVNISGMKSSNQISGKSYTVYLKNGSYQYIISTNDKLFHANASAFTVRASSLQENITFLPVYYKITFSETGLPTGTSWQVITNGMLYMVNNNNTSIKDQNGSYSYSVSSSAKYTAIQGSGSFVVSGNSLNFTIKFILNITKSYTAWFNETGLPSGYSWYLNISGKTGSGLLNSTSYNAILSNGTYNYTVDSVNKQYRPLYNGTFRLNGSNISINITFTRVLFMMKFTESGLSAGTTWYVNLSNSLKSGPISGNIFTFYLINGSYNYSIGSVLGYNATPSSGHVLIQGHNVSVSIAFSSGLTIGQKAPAIDNELLLAVVGIIAIIALIITGISRSRKL